MKRISASTISKLGAAHKEKFDAIQASHEASVNEILNDNTKSLAEKQEAIAALDRSAAAQFAELEEEAAINDEDVNTIRQKMQKASKAVHDATSRVSEMVTSSDLMMAEDFEAQKK